MSALHRYVLFVCLENAFRSIIAEALFNAYAPAGLTAKSAGIKPAERINRVAVELLGEIGVPVAERTPRLVTPELVNGAWRVITFGRLDRYPIDAMERAEDWPIPGSVGKDRTLRPREELLAIRGEIERRVLKLIHVANPLIDRITDEHGSVK